MAYRNRFDGMSATDLAAVLDPALASKDGYIKITRDGQSHYMHRWVWEQLVGPVPADHEIDHINGIRHDCRVNNLRCVPKVINKRNSKKQSTNTSGTTGVHRVCLRGIHYWIARWQDPITYKAQTKYFSTLRMTEDEAKAKAIDYRGMVMENLVANYDYSDRHGT